MLSYQIFINILKEYFQHPYMLWENFIMDRSTREYFWHVLSFSILNYWTIFYSYFSCWIQSVCHIHDKFQSVQQFFRWIMTIHDWLFLIGHWDLKMWALVVLVCQEKVHRFLLFIAIAQSLWDFSWDRRYELWWYGLLDKMLRKQLMLYIQLVHYMVLGDIFGRQNAKDASW